MGADLGSPEGDAYIQVPESQENLEVTPTKGITLDQWKFLQEQNWPKPEFNLRKTEFTWGTAVQLWLSSQNKEVGWEESPE